MPKAVLTPGQWKKVQEFVESTGDIPAAAKKWGVKPNAIHQKAHAKGWATPKRLMKEVLIAEAEARAKSITTEEAKTILSGEEITPLTTAAAKLAALREEMPPLIAENLAGKIKRSLVRLGDPYNYKELASAVSMLSTMLGLNKTGGGVNVNVGMAWGSAAPENGRPVVVVKG